MRAMRLILVVLLVLGASWSSMTRGQDSNFATVNANKLQGRDISTTAPVASQVLVWNAVQKKWEPHSVASLGPPSGNAGGSLKNSYPNPGIVGAVTDTPKFGSLLATNNAAAALTGTINAVQDGAQALFVATSYGTNVPPGFRGYSARGTLASPTATQSGDILGFVSGRGYGTTGFAGTSSGVYGIFASQNWTDSAQGAEVRVETTLNGTTTKLTRTIVTNDGRWVLGSAADASHAGLKSVGTTIQHRLGDDSAYAPTQAASFLATNNAAAVVNGMINAVGDGTEPVFVATAYGAVGATNAPGFRGYAARGTLALPTATQSGDLLAFVSGRGYGTTAFPATSAGRYGIFASENWTDSAQGAEVRVETTPNGGVGRTVRSIMTNDGRWVLGPTATSGVPSLKASGAALMARLGDDSGDAFITAAGLLRPTLTADTLPGTTLIKSQDAYPQAVTNVTGGGTTVVAGAAPKFFTIIIAANLSGATFTVGVDGTYVTLTDGIDFTHSAVEATEAVNLGGAITANGTLGAKVTVTVVSNVVYLALKSTCAFVYGSTSAAGGDATWTRGTDGTVWFPGNFQAAPSWIFGPQPISPGGLVSSGHGFEVVTDGAGGIIRGFTVVNANTAFQFVGFKSRGTLSSGCTAVLSGDQIALFGARAFGATVWHPSPAGISYTAWENASDTAGGDYLSVTTIPLGSTAPATRLRIDSGGTFMTSGLVYGWASGGSLLSTPTIDAKLGRISAGVVGFGNTGTTDATLQAYGGAAASNTPPAVGVLRAQNAWAQATGANQTGANCLGGGGIGSRFYTIANFTNVQTNVNTFTLTVNSVTVVLTAGTDFQSVTDNPTAATNLGAAISGNGTLGAQLTVTVAGAVVYLQPKSTCLNANIFTNAAGGDATATQGGDGSLVMGASAFAANNNPLQMGIVANNGVNGATVALETFLPNSGGSGFKAYKARGTLGAPTAVQLGDSLWTGSCFGRRATGDSGTAAQLQCQAIENWSDTANGTYWLVLSTPALSTVAANQTRIDSTGVILKSTNFLTWASSATLTGVLTPDAGIARSAAGYSVSTLGTGTTNTGEWGAALYRGAVHATITGNGTTLDATARYWPMDATSAGFTVTLPTAVGFAGRSYVIPKIDATANIVTVTTTSSQTIGYGGSTTKTLTAQGASLTIWSDNVNWQVE